MLRIIHYFWIILFLFPLLIGAESNNQRIIIVDQIIPPSIIKKADQFIISRVGEAFFNKFVFFDRTNSKYNLADQFCIKNPGSCSAYLEKPYYLMVYSLKKWGLFANAKMEFALDEKGEVIEDREIIGVPDCVKDSEECDFLLDGKQVINIAKQVGLQGDSTKWKADFYWSGGFKTYVWSVSNNSIANPGQVVIIDANTGEVLDIN